MEVVRALSVAQLRHEANLVKEKNKQLFSKVYNIVYETVLIIGIFMVWDQVGSLVRPYHDKLRFIRKLTMIRLWLGTNNHDSLNQVDSGMKYHYLSIELTFYITFFHVITSDFSYLNIIIMSQTLHVPVKNVITHKK